MKKTVIFINAIRPATFEALEMHEMATGEKIVPVVFVDKKIKKRITERNGQTDHIDKVPFIEVDFDSPKSIRKALANLAPNAVGIVSQYENSMTEFKKLSPYVPYLLAPSESSVTWSTEKKFMRELMGAFDQKIVPKYVEIHEPNESMIEKIEDYITFPVIVKPSGLEGSLLVARADNLDELKSIVLRSFEKINEAYDIWIKRQKPFLLVEEFMEGSMYSIDSYIDRYGDAVHLPFVKIVTGHSKGLQDFYGYVRTTPTELTKTDIDQATTTVESAIRAVGLRSTTSHTEIMRTADGWKIIEIGPRIGGYRHQMYLSAFGINHIANDILNRIGKKPITQTKHNGFSAMLNIYATGEGTIQDIKGTDIVSSLESHISTKQNLTVGDNALFARNNGDPIFEIELFNKNEDILNSDINVIDKELIITVQDK